MKRFLLVFFLIYFTLVADNNFTSQELNFRDKITNGYHRYLNALDCFVANYDDINQTNFKKISKSRLYVILSLKNTKNNPFQQDLYLRANIKLPQIQNRLEITLNKQTPNSVDNQNIDANYEHAIEDEKLRIGLKYYFYKEQYSVAYAKLGFRLHSPFGVYTKLGIEKSYFYNTLQIIPKNVLYYYINKQQLIASTALMFFHLLSDSYSIQQRNEFIYNDALDTIKLEHTLSLYHFLNVRNRLKYQFTYANISDEKCDYCPNWYGANIVIHHQIVNGLYFEIVPQVSKRRENSFKFEKALTINFGIVFPN